MEAEKAGKPLTIDQIDLYRRERLALSKLTEKEKVFAEVYCRTFDKLLALKEAGYWTPQARKDNKGGQGGSQTKLIESNFNRVIERQHVAEYIKLLKQSVASRLGVSMDSIVEEYKVMAFAKISDYYSWDKNGIKTIKDSSKLTLAQKSAIMEMTETTTDRGSTLKFKLFPKQAALDRLFEVLKELEEHEMKPAGPANISQTQINVMLQDSTMRRAIEYMAKHLYDKQISLVGDDKALIEFNQNLDKVMAKVTEATSGISGTGPIGIPQLPQGENTGREGADAGNHRRKNQKTENEIPETEKLVEGEKGGAALDDADLPVEEGNRYPVDGL